MRTLNLVICLSLVLGGACGYAAEDAVSALTAEVEKLSGTASHSTTEGITTVITDAQAASAKLCAEHLHLALPRLRALAQIPREAPVPEQFVVVLFAKRETLDKFLKARKAPANGRFAYLHHDDPGNRLIAGLVLDPRPMFARLRHAATEALLRAWIPEPPAWVLTGLGEALEDVDLSGDGVRFGPPRGHLRDLRERVFQAEPSPLLPLQELLRKTPGDFEELGTPGALQAWAFARFLLEDPLPREASLMGKLLSSLDPKQDAKANGKRAYEFFVEDEWPSIERAWKLYLAKLSETPADKAYRDARDAIAKRNYETARGLLDAAIKADPDYERIYYFRALCAFYKDDAKAAVADLDQALAIFPEYHGARYLRARARAAMEDPQGAKQDFEACLDGPYREQARKQLETLK